MKNSLKKLMASATAVAIVTMNMASMTVNAAALNGATAVVTPATKIVITSAGNFTGATTCNAVITRTNTDGTTSNIALTAGLCAVTDVNSLTVNSTNVAAAEYYTITFSTDNGIFGSATAGDTTNDVLVTATVVPTLTMSLSVPTLALGVLGTAAYVASSVDVVTATNAIGGATVTMAAGGLRTGDLGTNKLIGGANATTSAVQTAALDYYKVSTNAGASNLTLVDGSAAIGAVGGADIANTQTILTGTTPTDSSVTTKVTVGAKIAATTEAGNYSDTLTFTTVGTF